jgi:DNA replicative helicase MCM subunit Mcm2 (Cdc46/Mcm family)
MSLYNEDKITYFNNDDLNEEKEYNNINNINNKISIEFAKKKFKLFIRNFKELDSFIYREQLLQNLKVSKYLIEIKIEDLNSFDEKLATQFIEDPSYFISPVKKIF